MPCTKQEKMSRRLALRRLSTPNLLAMSFAIDPVMIRAIVLFAVQRLARLISAAIQPSAPFRPRTRETSLRIIQSIPPLKRIISSIPPAKRLMMISSPMPVIPEPIAAVQPQMSNPPVNRPTRPESRMPRKSTNSTFTPAMAVAMTIR